MAGLKDKKSFFEAMVSEREFWTEDYLSYIKEVILSNYKTEVIRNYLISDLVIIRDNKHGDKMLIKWAKRFMPLSDEELLHDYGKKVKPKK